MIGLQEGASSQASAGKFRGYIKDNGLPKHTRLLGIFTDGWIPLTTLLPQIIPSASSLEPAYEIAGKELTRVQLRAVADLLIELGMTKPREEIAMKIAAGVAHVPLPPMLFARVVGDDATATIVAKVEGHEL